MSVALLASQPARADPFAVAHTLSLSACCSLSAAALNLSEGSTSAIKILPLVHDPAQRTHLPSMCAALRLWLACLRSLGTLQETLADSPLHQWPFIVHEPIPLTSFENDIPDSLQITLASCIFHLVNLLRTLISAVSSETHLVALTNTRLRHLIAAEEELGDMCKRVRPQAHALALSLVCS